MSRAKRREVGAGLTVVKHRRSGFFVKTKGKWKATSVMKRFLKSSTSAHQKSISLSSTKGDDDKLLFTRSFCNPIQGDSLPNDASFRPEACSDFCLECRDRSRIGRWGYWNHPDKENEDADDHPVLERKVTPSKKSHGFFKFMSWASIHVVYSKLSKKRLQKLSARVCQDVVDSLERLHIEQYDRPENADSDDCTKANVELAANAEVRESMPASLNTFPNKNLAAKSSFGRYKLTYSESRSKLMSRKFLQNKPYLRPAKKCEKNATNEELKSSYKAVNARGSQLLKKLIRFVCMNRRNAGLKNAHGLVVEESSSRSWRRSISPSAQMIPPELNNLHSAESTASTGRMTGTIKVFDNYRKPRPDINCEKAFSRLSSNVYPFPEIGSNLSIGNLNTIRGNLYTTNSSCNKISLPIIAINHERRSAITLEASSGHTADLASLNAKKDMRFEHVLAVIDEVDNQVKRSVQSQRQTCKVLDDEESIFSRLIGSRNSDLGTVERELSPFTNCVSISQLVDSPIIKEFKEAVVDSHLKIRVLAGLLTVEKDAKMASVRDFQSKRMILTMTMMGAQMLEGELLLEKPWHFKYLLDYCVNSIFFNGPHSSSHCICSRQSSFSNFYKSAIFDSFCNDIDFVPVTFESFCDEAVRAVEELVGSKAKAWSDALTNMFWNCAVCCFQVHKLIVAIRKCKQTVQILHHHRGTSFDAWFMDPLDTGNFSAFHRKVLFTIFSGFILEGKVLCKSQVYLEPKVAAITL